MPGRMLLVLGLVAMGLAIGSCEKLPNPRKPTPTMTLQSMPFVDAIPAEYGDLVSVTVDPSMPYSAQLWFQKSDKSVVVVFADTRNHFIGPQYLMIPRR